MAFFGVFRILNLYWIDPQGQDNNKCFC